MRNFAMASAVKPRPVRYSRARAPSAERNCASNQAVANSCNSSSLPRCRFSSASSGEENSRLGRAMPHFWATILIASVKPTFSIFCTNEKTSPDAPQPKQW